MPRHLERAVVHIQQSRMDKAEEELRAALAQDPDEPLAHSLLSICLCQRNQFAEAQRESEIAVGLAPDFPFAHYALATVLAERRRWAESEAAINAAIELAPDDPKFFALLGRIKFSQEKWTKALEAANNGLQHDAENVDCANVRAMALVKLGRRDEAGATLAETLAKDPDNAESHANQGWTLLNERKPKEAMTHFREALRIDPEMDWAKAGIVEALKARNPIYRWLLMYFLWMARLSPRMRWAVVIGGYIGFQFLRRIAVENPEALPWLMPILIAYVIFALGTWIAQPLFNLLLRLHPIGKHALNNDQIWRANLVGIILTLGLGCVIGYFLFSIADLLLLALYFGLLLVPVSAIHSVPAGWPRSMMVAAVALLMLAGGLPIVTGYFPIPALEPYMYASMNVFIFGSIASPFLANVLAGMQPRR